MSRNATNLFGESVILDVFSLSTMNVNPALKSLVSHLAKEVRGSTSIAIVSVGSVGGNNQLREEDSTIARIQCLLELRTN
mmetsp:Transcript_46045/g.68577  ORF Transcript_46045/g.68577 Transcript_46045/m.68577 type:complete len:80 (-) Transcript_46045:45-284(-)